MTPTLPCHPSLADRVRPIAAGAAIVGVHFLGKTPVFVLGEEALLFAGDDEKRVAIHAGGILVSASDGQRIVTGGDDGTLVATEASGEHRVLATDDKKRWIDQVALGPDGAVAWSAGKVAHVLTKKGEDAQPGGAVDGGRARFRAQGLPRRPSRTTTASRSGFPTPPAPSRRSSNGKART